MFAAFPKHRQAGFGFGNFLAHGEIGEYAPVALNRMIRKIGDHPRAHHRHDNLTRAMLEFLIDTHGRMETQRKVLGQ
jgi:hypothetical protein